ncbi:hypothetical protein [Sulfurivirga sp.]|uniref:hypothetical protein n=1 Tax=Sulfurivirga sp. TaxID=2614236 RepID=UPI0025F5049C|nr:hypothetical protein [Sulfurivirga sp.]
MARARTPFTWHYYAMAAGTLAAILAALLGGWSAAMSAAAFAIVSHPGLKFTGLTRQVFMALFLILFVFAFPREAPPGAFDTASPAATEQR